MINQRSLPCFLKIPTISQIEKNAKRHQLWIRHRRRLWPFFSTPKDLKKGPNTQVQTAEWIVYLVFSLLLILIHWLSFAYKGSILHKLLVVVMFQIFLSQPLPSQKGGFYHWYTHFFFPLPRLEAYETHVDFCSNLTALSGEVLNLSTKRQHRVAGLGPHKLCKLPMEAGWDKWELCPETVREEFFKRCQFAVIEGPNV